MDSNTYSTEPRARSSAEYSAGPPDSLAAFTAAAEDLAAQDLDGLPDAVRAERVLRLRRLLDRLEGHWLAELAAVDARGAAGAEDDVQAGSTAGWLRARLRMGGGAARGCVRTARALFRGPLTATARALTDGQLSPAHASVLAHGTYDLPHHVTAEAEPVLLDAARRLDPPRAPAGGGPPAGGDRPRHHQPSRTPPCAAGAVAGPDLGGHGRPGRAVGTRGRPDLVGGVGAVGPPGQRR